MPTLGGVQTSVPAKQSSFPVGRGRSAMLQAAISGHTSKDQTQTGRQVGQSNVNVPAFAIARSVLFVVSIILDPLFIFHKHSWL